MSDRQSESPRVTVSNYSKIWTWDWVIYAFEGKKLPVPANVRAIGTFFACLVFWSIFGKILFFLPDAYIYVVLPFVSAWLIMKQKLDGKAPHKWLLSMIFHWIRPKHLRRYRPIQHNKRYTYGSKVVYRTHRERA
ncbi:TcpE family conjugal transfer membrane protein (plasmid) [Paenibacillus urinalis]|uniref:TcpE family conjugal transfer membrane protein n=2 Tax=Paenibacillus TaxID=44249 RepID=A0AAX3N6W7_9BACL|nr:MULTISPECIES: TcpE family conjugal transfer membrane protein [Paenibacillus]MCM3130522.1 conjugal transfer protein [Paenibacillus sp. MER 78]WDH85408.1 TcpE family conjugal transfer membrane protein [Paenibacillus urinalis]WDH95154.1 TcpE family conjugal transfer membrane protein [Paenibacillus urinalis]WDI05374.1 TcpE family conjugal transfer membrane protein [Paenibacillus urinalis]SDX62813.1 TcpE family protein [Paenibacillus sp. PDC88]